MNTLFIVIFLILALVVIARLSKVDYSEQKDSKDLSEDEELKLYRYNKHQYLLSPEWDKKRKAALKTANYECTMCHLSTSLQVHHISYKNLFREQPSDLVALCDHCHELVHNKYGFPASLKAYESFYGPPIKLY